MARQGVIQTAQSESTAALHWKVWASRLFETTNQKIMDQMAPKNGGTAAVAVLLHLREAGGQDDADGTLVHPVTPRGIEADLPWPSWEDATDIGTSIVGRYEKHH